MKHIQTLRSLGAPHFFFEFEIRNLKLKFADLMREHMHEKFLFLRKIKNKNRPCATQMRRMFADRMRANEIDTIHPQAMCVCVCVCLCVRVCVCACVRSCVSRSPRRVHTRRGFSDHRDLEYVKRALCLLLKRPINMRTHTAGLAIIIRVRRLVRVFPPQQLRVAPCVTGLLDVKRDLCLWLKRPINVFPPQQLRVAPCVAVLSFIITVFSFVITVFCFLITECFGGGEGRGGAETDKERAREREYMCVCV